MYTKQPATGGPVFESLGNKKMFRFSRHRELIIYYEVNVQWNRCSHVSLGDFHIKNTFQKMKSSFQNIKIQYKAI